MEKFLHVKPKVISLLLIALFLLSTFAVAIPKVEASTDKSTKGDLGNVGKSFTASLQTSKVRIISDKQVTSGTGYDLFPLWSPDGTKFLFYRFSFIPFTTEEYEHATVFLYISDLEGELVGPIEESAFQNFTAYAAWSPSGTKIVYSLMKWKSENRWSELFIFDTLRMEKTRILQTKENETIGAALFPINVVDWLSDDEIILIRYKFSNFRLSLSTVEIVDTQGNVLKILIQKEPEKDHSFVYNLFMSNNRKTIGFIEVYYPNWPDYSNPTSRIWLMDTNGNNQRLIAEFPQYVILLACFSPDDSKIIIERASGVRAIFYAIDVIDVNTKSSTFLTSTFYSGEEEEFSLEVFNLKGQIFSEINRNKIVYGDMSMTGGSMKYGIWLLDIVGHERMKILQKPLSDRFLERMPKEFYTSWLLLFSGPSIESSGKILYTFPDNEGRLKIWCVRILFPITVEEAKRLAQLANSQAEYFKSISDSLKIRMNPKEYGEKMFSEWKQLGDELMPKPGEVPLEFLLKIFRADEVKTMGDLCKAIVVPFGYLSETTFWNEFWMKPEVRGRINTITNKLDRLALLYSKEAECWNKLAEGKMSIQEIVEVLKEEKEAIKELKSTLNINIPPILSEFKLSPYKPLTIVKEKVNEGETHEYYFELKHLPKFIDIEVMQSQTPNWWESRPHYQIKLKIIKVSPATMKEEGYLVKETGGTKLKMSEYETTTSPLLGPPTPLKFKLIVTYRDLGLDNYFTFWVDDGIKSDDIKITMKYGPEKETYIDIYENQATGLENFWKSITKYLDNLNVVAERTINQLQE